MTREGVESAAASEASASERGEGEGLPETPRAGERSALPGACIGLCCLGGVCWGVGRG